MACQDPDCKNCNAPWRDEDVVIQAKAGALADMLNFTGRVMLAGYAVGKDLDPHEALADEVDRIVASMKEQSPGFAEMHDKATAKVDDYIQKIDQSPLN